MLEMSSEMIESQQIDDLTPSIMRLTSLYLALVSLVFGYGFVTDQAVGFVNPVMAKKAS